MALYFLAVKSAVCKIYSYLESRNTLCGKWYLPHSRVHNEQTKGSNAYFSLHIFIIHVQNGHIYTSGLKSDVAIDFLDTIFLLLSKICHHHHIHRHRFLIRRKNFSNLQTIEADIGLKWPKRGVLGVK